MKMTFKKPILFLIIALMAVFAVGNGAQAATTDSLLVVGGSGKAGELSRIIPINLRNATAVKALMFSLKSVADSLTVTAVTPVGRAAAFYSEFVKFGSTTRVLLIPANVTPLATLSSAVPGTTILNVAVTVKANTPGASKAIVSIDSLFAADASNVSFPLSTRNGVFWFGQKGDILYDASINLFDVLRLIDVVLSRPPAASEYEKWAGDYNSDGSINVLDISSVISVAVAATASAPVASGSGSIGSARIESAMIPQNFAGDLEVPVTLQTSVPLTGLELVFQQNDHFRINSAALTNLSKKMLIASRQNGGEVHVMLYSLDGQQIPIGAGTVLSLPITVTKSLEQSEPVQISSALAGAEGGKAVTTYLQTSTQTQAVVPQCFALFQNSPNPFNMSTVITYDVPQAANPLSVQLQIFNTQGQLVRTLEDQLRTTGRYKVLWDGQNNSGAFVSSGIYFYKLIAGSTVLTRKLAVMK